MLIRLDVDREAPLTTRHLRHPELPGRHRPGLHPAGRRRQAGAAAVARRRQRRRAFRCGPACSRKLEERGEAILDQVRAGDDAREHSCWATQNQKRVAAALDNLSRAADNTQQLASNINATVKGKLDPALDQATATLRGAQRTRRPGRRRAAQSAPQRRRSARPPRSSARRRSASMPPADRSIASRKARMRWRMRPRPSPPPRCPASTARPTKPPTRYARSIVPSTTSRRTRRC